MAFTSSSLERDQWAQSPALVPLIKSAQKEFQKTELGETLNLQMLGTQPSFQMLGTQLSFQMLTDSPFPIFQQRPLRRTFLPVNDMKLEREEIKY